MYCFKSNNVFPKCYVVQRCSLAEPYSDYGRDTRIGGSVAQLEDNEFRVMTLICYYYSNMFNVLLQGNQ